VSRQSSVVGRRSSVLGRRSSAVGRLSSVVGRRSSVVGRRSSVVGRLSSVVGRRQEVLNVLNGVSQSWNEVGLEDRRPGNRSSVGDPKWCGPVVEAGRIGGPKAPKAVVGRRS
jgi:hypothetical protein